MVYHTATLLTNRRSIIQRHVKIEILTLWSKICHIACWQPTKYTIPTQIHTHCSVFAKKKQFRNEKFPHETPTPKSSKISHVHRWKHVINENMSPFFPSQTDNFIYNTVVHLVWVQISFSTLANVHTKLILQWCERK